MKVLHVGAGNLYGGIETVKLTLAECRDLSPSMTPEFAYFFEGRIAFQIRESGAKVTILPSVRYSRPWTVWKARNEYHKLITEVRPDVVVAHELWVHGIVSKTTKKLNIPLVTWLHDRHDTRRWIDLLYLRSSPNALVVNSHYCDEKLDQVFPGVPRRVIYNPMRIRSPIVEEKTAIRQELGIKDETKIILHVSRFDAWKGHLNSVRAIAKLKDNPNWEWWVAGKAERPDEEAHYNAVIEECKRLDIQNRVRFLGFRPDVPKLMKAADIFLQLNETPEPFGMVFLEAMMAELPIVTADMGGAKEIVTTECGYRVNSHHPEETAKILQELLSNAELSRQLGLAGSARAIEISEPSEQIRKLADWLEIIVENSREST
jgi:glycosyltransferase involved in cell wall biosynthesis